MVFIINRALPCFRLLALTAVIFGLLSLADLSLLASPVSTQLVLLMGLGFVGGVLNAVAGGAAYIIFPTLVFFGIAPLQATMTTKLAIWAGSVTSAMKFHHDIKTQPEQTPVQLKSLLPVAVGSVLGAVLLWFMPNDVLKSIVPWLMLGATLVLMVGKDLSTILKKVFGTSQSAQSPRVVSARGFAEFVVGVYGGFFAAGMAFFLLAIYQVAGEQSSYRRNVLKTYAQFVINTVSSCVFVFAGGVMWPMAIMLMAGTALGGWTGAYVAKYLPETWVRWGTIVFALLVTGKLFGLIEF